ncbi:MAG: hypothetical protein U9P44_01990, partial [archaeon]|nr:hypothetical protein [archaeon]
VIGAVKNTIRIFGTDILSGQRAIKREILKDLGDFSKFRYGLEVRLNKYILDNDVMFKTVSLKRVQNKFKMEKIGFVPGLFLDIKMMHEIFKSIGKREYVRQAIFMPVKNKRIKDMLRVR